MSVRSFFDSNILVYTDDQRYLDRHDRAKELIKESLRARLGVVSTQVLQEYFAVSTRKLDVPVDVARAKVAFFSRFNVVLIDPPLILDAIDLHAAHQWPSGML
jgi:predicted nucleic acid-binding protein